MATNGRDDEHDELIDRVTTDAAGAADGGIAVNGSEKLSAVIQEQFWRNVAAFEAAGTTDLVKELTAIGVALPEPAGLDDAALHDTLWLVIDGLARLNVFLQLTDHLSDRELYTRLVRELLPEEMPALDTSENSAWHIDVLGYECPELYLKYYADETTRESWRKDFPDAVIPDREDPPHDRDRRLPR